MNPVQFHFEGQVAVVTGAAQGIGAACAERLAQDGAAVALWDLDETRGKALVRTIEARGQRAIYLNCNVASSAEVNAAVRATLTAFGRIDALINNASSFYPTALDTLTAPQFDDLLTSNLRGPLFLAQACARHMGPGSSIVNLLDIHARKPMPGYVAYCAAKAALWSVTESLAVELAPRIRVNGVAPGRMIWGAGDNLDDAQKAAEQARIPMARLGGGDEVSRAVCFLVSEAAAYVNGAILPVDGGLRLA